MKATIISDLHIPFHSFEKLESVIKHIRKYKPEILVINGDLADCAAISRFISDPRKRDFEAEMRATANVLYYIQTNKPTGTELIVNEGNHELRIQRYINKEASGFAGIINFVSLMKLMEPRLSFEWRPNYSPLILENVIVKHGFRLSSVAGGYSVKKELDRESQSVVMGHCHRLARIARTYRDRTIYGVEGGHLCDSTKIDYCNAEGNSPDWEAGFVDLIEVSTGLMPIIRIFDKNTIIA